MGDIIQHQTGPKSVLVISNLLTDSELDDITFKINTLRETVWTNVYVVHIMPTVPHCYFTIPAMATLTRQHHVEAEKWIKEIGMILNIPASQQNLKTGKLPAVVSQTLKQYLPNLIFSSQKLIDRIRQAASGSKHFLIHAPLGGCSFLADEHFSPQAHSLFMKKVSQSDAYTSAERQLEVS
jgi:hypothetical protein